MTEEGGKPSEPDRQSSWEDLSILSECEASIVERERERKKERKRGSGDGEKRKKEQINQKEAEMMETEWKVVFRGETRPRCFLVCHSSVSMN